MVYPVQVRVCCHRVVRCAEDGTKLKFWMECGNTVAAVCRSECEKCDNWMNLYARREFSNIFFLCGIVMG